MKKRKPNRKRRSNVWRARRDKKWARRIAGGWDWFLNELKWKGERNVR